MGMNICNIHNVVNLGCPSTVHAVVQQEGRAGRDGILEARGHTYVEAHLLEAAAAVRPASIPAPLKAKHRDTGLLGTPSRRSGRVDEDGGGYASDSKVAPGKAAKRPHQVAGKIEALKKGGKTGRTKADKLREAGEKLDPGLLRLLLAHLDQRCLVAEKNRFYGNDKLAGGQQAGRSCLDAKRPFPCSSCRPYSYPRPLAPNASTTSTPTMATLPSKEPTVSDKLYGPPLPPPLKQELREHAARKLAVFSRQRWLMKSGSRFVVCPDHALWEGISLSQLLDKFHLVRGDFGLREHLGTWKYLEEDGAALCELVIGLNNRYDTRYVKAKHMAVEKRKATLQKKKAATANPPPPPPTSALDVHISAAGSSTANNSTQTRCVS